MKGVVKVWVSVMLLAIAAPMKAEELEDVRKFFDEFVESSNAFDQEVVNLYRPNAKIITVRDGTDRLELTGEEWRVMLNRTLPLAKERGDTNQYSDVNVLKLSDKFRVISCPATLILLETLAADTVQNWRLK